jgi:trimethylamine--corrinoid protein Co-methyltransferase
MQGFDFNETQMALEMIKNVGPGGHFLMEDHTIKHVRDFRLSSVLHKRDENGNFQDPLEMALEEFKRIDMTHHLEPLPQEVLSELDRILTSAERDAENK